MSDKKWKGKPVFDMDLLRQHCAVDHKSAEEVRRDGNYVGPMPENTGMWYLDGVFYVLPAKSDDATKGAADE